MRATSPATSTVLPNGCEFSYPRVHRKKRMGAQSGGRYRIPIAPGMLTARPKALWGYHLT